jgi:class 3 adenylate cyclase
MKTTKLFLLLVAFAGMLQAQPVVIGESGAMMIGKQVHYLVDTSGQMTAEQANAASFTPVPADIPNFGNLPHPVWMKFSLSSDSEKEVFLDVMAPLLENIVIYRVDSGQSLHPVFDGSFRKPFKERQIISESWLFELSVSSGAGQTYLMKVVSGFPLLTPLLVSTKKTYVEWTRTHNLFWGLYMGVIIFAFLYNLFIYFSVRERTYLYYVAYIAGSFVFYLGLQGYAFEFLWPSVPAMNALLPLLICLTNICITFFAFRFLRISKETRKWQFYFGLGMIVVFALIGLVTILGAYPIAAGLAQLFSLVACLYFIYIGISALRRGVPTARFYLLSWSLFLVFVMIYIFTINNALPSNFFTTHCIFIGHMTEVLLLSFALADRINWLKNQNEKQQREIILQMEEKEKIQLQANAELEKKVIERTAEVVEQRNEAIKQRERSDELLLNILPEETAEELKTTGKANAKLVSHVTVLFTDMKDFTRISEELSPTELVAEINECFSAFDKIMERYGVEKIKTIGDAYMAAGGLPSPNETHAYDVVSAALEIQQFMDERGKQKRAEGKEPFEIRIGIHTGPVVAGIVGIKKFAYDIWGDTVNIASRMESSGEAGKVNISASTYELINQTFNCEYRGKIEAKNKGNIDMYFVNGRKG